MRIFFEKIYQIAFYSGFAVLAMQPSSVLAQVADAAINPYGLQALWAEGDLVAKSTLMILIVMSMASWYMIVTKLLSQIRVGKQAKEVQDGFWTRGSIRESADLLDPQSPFRFVAERGLESATKHDGLLGAIDFNTWVTMKIQLAMTNVQSRMQDGLALLATVGSTAPFVGLFGTVIGIIHAFRAIAENAGIAGAARHHPGRDLAARLGTGGGDCPGPGLSGREL